MPELAGTPGEIAMTIAIRRAATGKTETFELTGKVDGYGGDALHGGEKRGD